MENSSNNIDELRGQLKELLKINSIVDRNTGWISLYKLLTVHDTRKRYVEIIVNFLDYLFPKETLNLLVPDLLASTNNFLPASCIAAHLRKDNLAIWREVGDELNGLPLLLKGTIPNDINCVILQDVVESGVTIKKILPDITKIGWKIYAYVTLIQAYANPVPLQDTLSYLNNEEYITNNFKYSYLLDINDLYS